MSDREELAALRRLAELEARAAGDFALAGVKAGRADRRAAEAAHKPDAYEQAAQAGGPVETFLAGVGAAMKGPYLGVKQMAGQTVPREIEDYKRSMAGLNSTPSGMAGNVVGNVAATAPLVMAPGASTIGGGIGYGALTGAVQPVGEGESRWSNTVGGGATGGLIPAAMRTGSAVKAAVVDPFTEAGKSRIAGGVLNRAAANPRSVMARLLAAKGETPGFNPTVGQAADDAGVAALERTMRAVDPRGFDAIDKSQRGALADALRNMAGTPESRQAAIDAREAAVKPLYDQAKQATVTGDAALDALLQRPSMQSAAARAANIAKERGEKFQLSQARPAQTSPTGLLDADGNPITQTTPAQAATYPGKSLHDLKMGLDDAIGTPGIGGMQGAERAAALGTKDEFLNWLESQIPAYGQAKTTYAGMSKPINQMDIGKELYQRFVPALADTGGVPFKSRADALAQALRGGDDLARNVTGMKGATLEGTMSPEQMATLRGVVSDAEKVKAAEAAGRGTGSDTVQKLSMSHLAAEAGIPNWMASIARVPGGWMKRAGDVLYKSSDEDVRAMLADALRNPQQAAEMMQKAGASPSQIANTLRMVGQSSSMALPAILANPAQQ